MKSEMDNGQNNIDQPPPSPPVLFRQNAGPENFPIPLTRAHLYAGHRRRHVNQRAVNVPVYSENLGSEAG